MRCSLLLLLAFAPLLRADLVSHTEAKAYALDSTWHPTPGCGGASQGPFSADAAFDCTFIGSNGTIHSMGQASADIGLGPLGIGLQVRASSSGSGYVYCDDAQRICHSAWPYSEAQASFTDTFTVAGGSGAGFMRLSYSEEGFDRGIAEINILVLGIPQTPGASSSGLLPITFGGTYSISATARGHSLSPDTDGLPSWGEWHVMEITIFGADGTPLGNGVIRNNDVFIPTPEPGSIALLASVLVLASWKMVRH